MQPILDRRSKIRNRTPEGLRLRSSRSKNKRAKNPTTAQFLNAKMQKCKNWATVLTTTAQPINEIRYHKPMREALLHLCSQRIPACTAALAVAAPPNAAISAVNSFHRKLISIFFVSLLILHLPFNHLPFTILHTGAVSLRNFEHGWCGCPRIFFHSTPLCGISINLFV